MRFLVDDVRKGVGFVFVLDDFIGWSNEAIFWLKTSWHFRFWYESLEILINFPVFLGLKLSPKSSKYFRNAVWD